MHPLDVIDYHHQLFSVLYY